MKDCSVRGGCREDLLKIFQKMSDKDLIRMYNILHELDIQGFALSFCIEILEDRGYDVYHIPKVSYDK